MTRRVRKTRYRLNGFVLPLAIVLVFGIMSVTSSLIGAVTILSRMARMHERNIVDRISLESATIETAAQLSKSVERPYAPYAAPLAHVNGRAITTVVSAPEGKYDINVDSAAAIQSALRAADLEDHVVQSIADALATGSVLGAPGPNQDLDSLISKAKLSAAEDDCVRRILTDGRWPAPRFEEAAFRHPRPGDTRQFGEILRRSLRASDQIDLRSEFASPNSEVHILWARIRLTGDGLQPALSHAWRLATLHPRSSTACALVLPEANL